MGYHDGKSGEVENTRRLTHREAADLLDGTSRHAQAIPVIKNGSPLDQGTTYVDLTRLDLGPFIAVAGQSAIEGQLLVPRRMIDSDLWRQLVVHEADRARTLRQSGQSADT